MDLLAWFFNGSLDFWAFQDSAEVCVEHRVHGKVIITLEGSTCRHSAMQVI
jgi:hypothetical protein